MKARSGSRRTLCQADAGWLLRNPRGLRVLAACVGGPVRLSQIAPTLELPLNTLWRLATELCRRGLLKTSHHESRAGRALRWYVATAETFFIPYEAEREQLPEDVIRRLVAQRVETQVRGLTAAATQTLKRSGVRQWGTLIYADRHGSPVVRPEFIGGRTPALLDGAGPAYLNFYSDDLRLTAADAKALQIELVGVVKRYKAQTGPRRYSLSAVLAPMIGGARPV